MPAERQGRHVIVWFRRDLRLHDNPAWNDATQQADVVSAIYVIDPALFDRAHAQRQALLVSHLTALDSRLAERGGRLRIVFGDPATEIPKLASEIEASAVYWNADTTPYAQRRDNQVAAALPCPAQTHWGTLTHTPGSVLTGKGTLSKVFTPFWKVWDRTDLDPWPSEAACHVANDPGAPLPPVETAPPHPGGEVAAQQRLEEFLGRVDGYLDRRDLPAVAGTSELSADLRFGTLSPRAVAREVGDSSDARIGFVRQLAWRDWYAHMLLERPEMLTSAVKPDYDKVRWLDDDEGFEAWRTGTTGYPIVDAGMRQLLTTGWMHNRVRMIVGSFLVKDLLIDWRRGERWFRHRLIDADVSQNVGNWQWVAGTGTDAAPYFRVFNPISQSRKFDAAGDYIRTYVTELAGLDAKSIHAPWEVAPLDLASSGVILGDTYPEPIVDHAMARERVLNAYKLALGKA